MTNWDQLKDELQKRINTCNMLGDRHIDQYILALNHVQDMMNDIEKEREPIKEPEPVDPFTLPEVIDRRYQK